MHRRSEGKMVLYKKLNIAHSLGSLAKYCTTLEEKFISLRDHVISAIYYTAMGSGKNNILRMSAEKE